MSTSILKNLYRTVTGAEPSDVVQLASSGSNRRYYRLCCDGYPSLIGVIGTCVAENKAFLYMDKHFADRGINVPKVVAISQDGMSYLQEDLGDTLLFNAIERGRLTRSFSNEERELLKRTIQALPKVQFMGGDGLDYNVCYPSSSFDERSIMWDLNYFKYCFLKATGLEFEESSLEDDFQAMAHHLLKVEHNTFMYRDFQSRNVMIHDDDIWFIDFQGGRKGPIYYDVASFLWQAKANFTDALRQELIDCYIEAAQQYHKVDADEFRQMLRHFVLFRTLQVLGAYGFRGYFEKKPHFMQSVPFAISNLRDLLKTPFEEYPYLDRMLRQLVDLKDFTDPLSQRNLTVKVMSFAYKKGIPADSTGNGGGFVFDCRAINNPGKYERYKPFTGLDKEVIQFLEDEGETATFLEHCYGLTDASVERYIERGFTSLMIAFGCTGGQHRSVYCAQHMAEHIHKKYNVKVELLHREQNIEQVFKKEERESE